MNFINSNNPSEETGTMTKKTTLGILQQPEMDCPQLDSQGVS